MTITRSALLLAELAGVYVVGAALFALLFPPPAYSDQRFPIDQPQHLFAPVVVAAALTILLRSNASVRVMLVAGLFVPFLAEAAFVGLFAQRVSPLVGDMVWAFPRVNVRELVAVLVPASLVATAWAILRAGHRRDGN